MLPLLAALALIPITIGVGIVAVRDTKANDQRVRDRQRRTYRLSFPADLEPEKVDEFFKSISGILRPRVSSAADLLGIRKIEEFFHGMPTIVLETWGTDTGITWYLKVPFGYEPPVRQRLESLIPGIQLTHETEPPSRDWTYATELKLHHGHRPLRVGQPIYTSVSIRSAFGHINQDEALIMQWIVAPMTPTKKPEQGDPSVESSWSSYFNGAHAGKDELNDRRNKAAETNLLTVVRVAAQASTETKASVMVRNVTSAFDATRSDTTYFKSRFMLPNKLRDRINRAVTPSMPSVQLTASELTCFIGWPLGDMTVPGQPHPPSLRRPTPNSVGFEGIKLGESNYGGRERPVFVGFKDALVHQHIIAPPGKGKTALLASEFKQIVDAGYGAIVIEQTGDLVKQVLDYIPPGRIRDVIFLDATDDKYPVGFNVLRQGNAAAVIDGIASIFESMYPDHPSMWAKRALYNGLHTLAQDDNATLIDLLALVSPTADEREWSRMVRDKATDPQVRRYWQEMQNDGKLREQEKMAPLNNRFWPVERSTLMNILGQSKSSFTMEEVVQQNKILIVNLAGIDSDASKIMGAMLVSALWHQVKATPMPHSPNYLIMDEAHHFMNLPIDLGLMLVEARKWGLGLMFAHQALYQLSSTMRQAVQQNMQTKIVFQMVGDDARDMARVLGNPITEYDVAHLGQFEAIARIATPSGMSAPLTMTTKEPAKVYGKAEQIRYISRQRFGRDRSKVEAEIEARRTAGRSPKSGKASKISGEDWGL